MAKKPSNKKKSISFFHEYKAWIISLAIILIAGYVIIYLSFTGKGFIPTGSDLEKKDWLVFLGAYITFAGTLFISFISILNSMFFAKMEKNRMIAERKKTIQPILAVKIVAINSQIDGTADVFDYSNPKSIPKHKNVTLEIKNAGQFPICNVIVFNQYKWHLLMPDETKRIQVAYSDSPDAKLWKKYITELLESDFERTDSGIPKSVNINYDDADGNGMFQNYTLKKFDGELYYSLDGTEEATVAEA